MTTMFYYYNYYYYTICGNMIFLHTIMRITVKKLCQ